MKKWIEIETDPDNIDAELVDLICSLGGVTSARLIDPAPEPVGYLSDESIQRLEDGGNGSRRTVPLHAEKSSVSKTPVFTHPAVEGVMGDTEISDRSYRNGFHAGWNAAAVGGEAALKAAMNRVGSKADYPANDTTGNEKLRDLLRRCYDEVCGLNVNGFDMSKSQLAKELREVVAPVNTPGVAMDEVKPERWIGCMKCYKVLKDADIEMAPIDDDLYFRSPIHIGCGGDAAVCGAPGKSYDQAMRDIFAANNIGVESILMPDNTFIWRAFRPKFVEGEKSEAIGTTIIEAINNLLAIEDAPPKHFYSKIEIASNENPTP